MAGGGVNRQQKEQSEFTPDSALLASTAYLHESGPKVHAPPLCAHLL
jgi:hypothetical protein